MCLGTMTYERIPPIQQLQSAYTLLYMYQCILVLYVLQLVDVVTVAMVMLAFC